MSNRQFFIPGPRFARDGRSVSFPIAAFQGGKGQIQCTSAAKDKYIFGQERQLAVMYSENQSSTLGAGEQ